jgi:hypothetical protein
MSTSAQRADREKSSSMQAEDIQWLEGMPNGLALAKQRCRAVVLKPLGQGCGDFDKW